MFFQSHQKIFLFIIYKGSWRLKIYSIFDEISIMKNYIYKNNNSTSKFNKFNFVRFHGIQFISKK